MANGKALQAFKDELSEKGCEQGRLREVKFKKYEEDVNGIGKKITKIWWGIVAVAILVLTNNELAAKIIEKIFNLK